MRFEVRRKKCHLMGENMLVMVSCEVVFFFESRRISFAILDGIVIEGYIVVGYV